MFIIYYPDRDDCHFTREEAVSEMRGFVPFIESVQHTSGKEHAGVGCHEFPRIGTVALIISPKDEGYGSDITVESDEFVSQEAVMEFVREAGLTELLEKKPHLLS